MRILPFISTLFILLVATTTIAADRNAVCSSEAHHLPYAANSGSPGIKELLKTVDLGTKWADLPTATKEQLQKFADQRLAAHRARWAGDALTNKHEMLLGCRTPEMRLAIDGFYQKRYDTVVPSTFTLSSLSNDDLMNALIRNYLGVISSTRARMRYPDRKHLNLDWDGKSSFDSIRLLDRQTFDDIKKYNAEVVAYLRSVDDASLTPLEKKLKERALYDARANAARYETACQIAYRLYDILAGYEADGGRPAIFATDEDVLREVNALFLHNVPVKWFDKGTLLSARKYCATDDSRVTADIRDSEIARDVLLLQNWWLERMADIADHNKCSVYSARDRLQVWEVFSANQQFNNDGSFSMESYNVVLDEYKQEKIRQYRDIAKLAIRRVFPDDTILTPEQRSKVISSIDANTAFGSLMANMPSFLDEAQSTKDSAAATHWRATVSAKVEPVGGHYTDDEEKVHKTDRDAIEAMFKEVKAWVIKEYPKYPIDIAAVIDKIPPIEVTLGDYPKTENNSAKIIIGVQTKRSKAEYYSWLIHELRHALFFAWKANAPDKSRVKFDEGLVLEGSGVAAEALLLEPFLRATLQDETAYTLYALDYGIRDARFAGTTDATLQRYFRPSCAGANDPDTINSTIGIAEAYGLTGDLANTVVERSHADDQYLQYVWNGRQLLKDIAYLQRQLDPSGLHRIDPFVLFACELNTPRQDAEYIAELKTCMKL